MAFHTDDSSIFLSPILQLFSWCGKDGWQGRCVRVSLLENLAKLILGPYPLVVVYLDYEGYGGHKSAFG